MSTEEHFGNSSIHSDHQNSQSDSDAKAPSPIQLNDVSKSVTAYSLNPSTFTQKLYVMLQDENLKDVIYWNDETKDSFFIIPNEKFIQVLSIFFKHCNTSSFVRQLNMYSFHKISGDTNNIWEFKHAESLFQKDDIESLYKVKRRSTVTRPSSINQKKTQPQKVPSYDSIPLKRKSLDSSREIEPKAKHRVSSLPNVISFNQNDNNTENTKNYESYYADLSNAESIEKQNSLINTAMGNGQTLRLDQRTHKGSQGGKVVDLHQSMLDELNAMNSSLQSICDLVEYSYDQMKNKPEGLSSNENAMYRQVFGKLFQDLNKKQFLLKQHFDLQYGPSNIAIYQQMPTQFQNFTPATPYGSFSINGNPPVMKRKGNIPEQLPIHPMPYQPQIIQQVINVPMNLKTPNSSSQAMYPMDKDKHMMMYQPHPLSATNPKPPVVYADQMMGGYSNQPQFRDVKYGNVQYNRPPSVSGYPQPVEVKRMMEGGLPNLKDVVGVKNSAGQDIHAVGVEMKKTASGGSPRSS